MDPFLLERFERELAAALAEDAKAKPLERIASALERIASALERLEPAWTAR